MDGVLFHGHSAGDDFPSRARVFSSFSQSGFPWLMATIHQTEYCLARFVFQDISPRYSHDSLVSSFLRTAREW